MGLRWRTQPEVVSGKGQFSCGCKGCSGTDGLCSFEVNFAYVEAGQKKQALVKLRLCPDCGYKLNWKKEKQYAKAAQKKRRREDAGRRERGDSDHELTDAVPRQRDVDAAGQGASESDVGRGGRSQGREQPEPYDNTNSFAPPPGLSAAEVVIAAAAARAASQASDAQSVKGGLAGSDALWENKPAQAEVSAEDEMDEYLSGLFE